MCARNAVHPGSVRPKKSSSECQPSRLLLVNPGECTRIACASSTSCLLRTSQSGIWNSIMGEANAGSTWVNLILLMNVRLVPKTNHRESIAHLAKSSSSKFSRPLCTVPLDPMDQDCKHESPCYSPPDHLRNFRRASR